MIKKKRKFVAITTLIDKDIVISGDTTYTGGIRIDGKINGNIKCHDYLELNTNAIVNGSIEYDIIEVHEGSKITGNLKFSKNSKKIEPKKNINHKIKSNLKKLLKK